MCKLLSDDLSLLAKKMEQEIEGDEEELEKYPQLANAVRNSRLVLIHARLYIYLK